MNKTEAQEKHTWLWTADLDATPTSDFSVAHKVRILPLHLALITQKLLGLITSRAIRNEWQGI